MEINGVTLQADFMDADFMDVFEPAIYKMQKGIDAGKTMQGNVAAKYRAMNTEGGKETVQRFFQ